LKSTYTHQINTLQEVFDFHSLVCKLFEHWLSGLDKKGPSNKVLQSMRSHYRFSRERNIQKYMEMNQGVICIHAQAREVGYTLLVLEANLLCRNQQPQVVQMRKEVLPMN